MLKFNFANN